MLATIKHQDAGPLVVVAKCLTGYIKTSKKISDADSYIKVNGTAGKSGTFTANGHTLTITNGIITNIT